MWSASFFFGNFIGPTVSGFLVDAHGFEWTTMVFFGLYGFILLVDVCELSYNVKKSQDSLTYERVTDDRLSDENLPLLENNR